VNRGRVSWHPAHRQRRIFGVFMGYTHDGLVKFKHGCVMHHVDPAEITWELN
jgi:hypothetical protein